MSTPPALAGIPSQFHPSAATPNQHELWFCANFPSPPCPPTGPSSEIITKFLTGAQTIMGTAPFLWRRMDRPPAGTLALIIYASSLPLPPDGVRYLHGPNAEVISHNTYSVGSMTLEIESLTAHSAYHPPTTIAEPSTDRTLSRFRKRWRIRPQSSAGQLGLNVVFWGQDETGNAQGIPGNVPPAPDSWSTEVIREYPLKPVNENAHYLQAGRAAQLQQQQHQQQMAQQQQQQQQMVQQQQQQQQQLPQSQHPTTQQVLSNLNLSGGSIANYPAMLAQQLQSQQAQAQMGHNPLSNVQPSMVSAFLKHQQQQQQQQQQQLSHPSLGGQGHPSNAIPSLAGTLNPQQLAVLAQQYQNRPPQTPQFGHPHQHPHALPHQQHQHSLPPQLQAASPHPSLQQVPATPRQQLALQPNMSSMSSMSSLSSMPQAQAQAMQQQMKMNFLQQQLRQQQQQQQQQQHQLQLQHQQQQQQQQLPMPPPQLSGPQMSLSLLPSAAQNIQQTAAPHALTHAHAQPHAPQRDQQAAREGHPMAAMLNMNLGGAAGMGMGMNLAALEEWHFDPMEGAFGKELAAKRLTMNMALLEKILGPEHLSMAERDMLKLEETEKVEEGEEEKKLSDILFRVLSVDEDVGDDWMDREREKKGKALDEMVVQVENELEAEEKKAERLGRLFAELK